MPDGRVEVTGVVVRGTWDDQGAVVPGTLVLETNDALLAVGEDAPIVIAPYRTLTDAVWADGALLLFRGDVSVMVTGPDLLQRACAVIVERACRVPELTRGLRTLGTHRGGNPRVQSRFFGPLLLARRRLQEPEPLEWRVSHFNAQDLSQRFATAIRELAEAQFPESAPDRRALEAVLGEALEPVGDALEALDETSRHVLVAPRGQRFLAWRMWTLGLRRVFLEADRAWGQIAPSLQETA